MIGVLDKALHKQIQFPWPAISSRIGLNGIIYKHYILKTNKQTKKAFVIETAYLFTNSPFPPMHTVVLHFFPDRSSHGTKSAQRNGG